MIRLFRKIRHNLLSEDKYSIYLLYAGGEIVLVVVGILFALQIDNWSQSRKDRNSEAYYLNQIRMELASDSLTLHEAKMRFAGSIPIIESLVQELNKEDNMETFNPALKAYLNNVWGAIYFTANSATFEEMKASAKLGIIEDRVLRNEIVKLYSQLNHTQTVHYENSEFLKPMDIKLSSEYSLARYLKLQEPVFGPYITEEDFYRLKSLKTELESNAANWHWTVVELLPIIQSSLDEIQVLMMEIENYLQ